METAATTYKDAIFPDGHSHGFVPLTAIQQAMLDASVDCIKIIAVDGTLRRMNRAGCVALGVDEDGGFGMPWLPLLPPGVHQAGLAALAEAREGRTARFPGRSEKGGDVRYWDNLLTPVTDEAGQVEFILCVSRDVTAKTGLERELEDAVEPQKLLAQEMRHRIKNVFAVVAGLITMSEREADAEAEGAPATEILRGKLAALARASDAVFAAEKADHASNAPVDVETLVASVLAPYGDRYASSGDRVLVRSQDVTSVCLFLHEMATNSVKYGAFGRSGGSVSLLWRQDAGQFYLEWNEAGGGIAPPAGKKQGFGSSMIDRVVRAAGGSVASAWGADGLKVDLRMPSPNAGDLET